MKEGIYGISFECGNAQFRLYDIRLEKRGEEFRQMGSHEHAYYELHFARFGSYDYTVDGKTVRLQRGELLILPPGVTHITVSADGQTYRNEVIGFSLNKIAGREGFYEYFSGTLTRFACRAVSVPSELIEQVTEWITCPRNDEIGTVCYRKARAGVFIHELFRVLDGFAPDGHRATANSDRSEDIVLLQVLVDQPGRTLREIAAAVHYSERHTARLIRQIYHLSLSELRKKRKMQAEQTVGEIKNEHH